MNDYNRFSLLQIESALNKHWGWWQEDQLGVCGNQASDAVVMRDILEVIFKEELAGLCEYLED